MPVMVSAIPHLQRWHLDRVIASRLVYKTTGMCWSQGSEVGPPWAEGLSKPTYLPRPNVSWGLWAYLRRQKIPRSDPSACSVFFPSCSRESGSEISLQPSCLPSCCWQPKVRSGAGISTASRIFILQSLWGWSRAVHGDPGQRPTPPGFTPWGLGQWELWE